MTITLAYRDALKRYVSRNASIDSRQGGGFVVRVKCEECESDLDALQTGTLLGPQALASKLRQRGWRLGTHNLCPEHKHLRKKIVMRLSATPANALPALPSTDKAREAKRLALVGLDESFVIDTGQYKGDKSDESIGKEVGLAAAAVAKLREELYGPLMPTGEFIKLRQELAAKIIEIDAIKNGVLAALRRLDGIAVQRGWAS